MFKICQIHPGRFDVYRLTPPPLEIKQALCETTCLNHFEPDLMFIIKQALY